MNSEEELRRAVAPVESYFHGAELTPGTVLAAWLRHEGVPASGEEWNVARAALQEGRSFEAAAQEAADLGIRRRGRAANPQRPTPRSAPRRAIVETPQTPEVVNGLPTMQQFAKPRTAGDLNAEGARRLLGAFSLDPVSVLVRETAQNSWDARLRRLESGVELTYHLFQATEAQARLLREQVFRGTWGMDPLEEALGGGPWLLEISDRGTIGLGGPTRNDLPTKPGDSTDYMDLVLNLGAPRDVAKGGGTYGFGKTIAYTMSKAETVLIWTKAVDPAEQRLIGSAMGSYFEHGGRAFTGRHWWGLPFPHEDRVEPLRNAAAEELAHRMFSRHFAADETGTSILIIAPDFGELDPVSFAEAMKLSVERELWPKLTEHPEVHPMKIHVLLNGSERLLAAPDSRSVLGRYGRCLQRIRDVNLGVKTNKPDATEIYEIRGGHKKTLIGHLAFAHVIGLTNEPSEEEAPLRRVCLMRNEAELVVRYHRVPGTMDAGEIPWVAVFKPLGDIEIDNEFALSEPPAHDDWVPPKKSGPSRVRIAFTRIKTEVDALTKPSPESHAAGEAVPVAALAHELAGLAPVSGPHSTGGRVARGSLGKPRLVILGADFAGAPPGRVAWNVEVDIQGPKGKSFDAQAIPVIASDGGGSADVDASLARIAGWLDPGSGAWLSTDASLRVRAGSRCLVRVEARADLAVTVKFWVTL